MYKCMQLFHWPRLKSIAAGLAGLLTWRVPRWDNEWGSCWRMFDIYPAGWCSLLPGCCRRTWSDAHILGNWKAGKWSIVRGEGGRYTRWGSSPNRHRMRIPQMSNTMIYFLHHDAPPCYHQHRHPQHDLHSCHKDGKIYPDSFGLWASFLLLCQHCAIHDEHRGHEWFR